MHTGWLPSLLVSRCSLALLLLGKLFVGFIWSEKKRERKHSSDLNRHRLRYCLCIDLAPVVDLEHWLEPSIWAKVVHVQSVSRDTAYSKSCFHSCLILISGYVADVMLSGPDSGVQECVYLPIQTHSLSIWSLSYCCWKIVGTAKIIFLISILQISKHL